MYADTCHVCNIKTLNNNRYDNNNYLIRVVYTMYFVFTISKRLTWYRGLWDLIVIESGGVGPDSLEVWLDRVG